MRKRKGDSAAGEDGFRAVFRPILLLAVTVFIDLLGFGIILPNLPIYIKQAVGPSDRDGAFMGGLLAASYSLTQFLCAPLWGRYSDRAGRRPVILLSLIGIAISYVFFGLADGHLWMLFTARLLAGFLSSASIGVAFAYVADVTTPQNRAKGLGMLGACFGLGFMMGPALGGILGGISLPLPAFVAAGMALLNFAFSLKMLPESLTAEERARRFADSAAYHPIELLRKVVGGPTGRLYALSFVSIFGFAAIEQAFGWFLMARHIADEHTLPMRFGYLMGFVGIVGIVIQGGMIGTLVEKLGEGTVARIGMAVLVAGYALLTLPDAWGPLIFLSALPISAGRSMMGPAISALISRKSQLGQGLNLSAQQSFDALARTVGPIAAGALFKSYGPTAPYWFSAALTLLALVSTFIASSTLELPPSGAAADA